MKQDDLLNALNYLPDEMIEQAAKGRVAYEKPKVAVAARFLKPVLAVASVALVCGVSIFAMSQFGIHTADEAAPEAYDKSLTETANENSDVKEDFDWQLSDKFDDADAETYYSASADMTVTETVASDIVVEGDFPHYGATTVNIAFTDGGIALRNSSGEVLSHIDLRNYSDSTEISVGTITLNHSKKNIKSVSGLLSLMEKSPVITPDSLSETEDVAMATLHFYISEGWSLLADSVHTPIIIEMELLSRGFAKVSVDRFDPLYISVGEEALTEFTNGLEYCVANE